MEVFKQSHLYVDEEDEYDDYYEEESYYPEEEGLEEFVGECIEALGSYLTDKQADRVAHEKIIEVLFAIYQHDLHADNSLGFASSAEDCLVQYTTPLERHTLAEWIRATLADEDEKVSSSLRRAYGGFLLELEEDTLDDETYLRICRETGRISDLIERLLTLGRMEEAAKETQQVNDHALLTLVDLFIQQGQDTVAEDLVRARLTEKPELHLLNWLQQYYQKRGNQAAELEIAETLFRTHPFLRRYQELHILAGQLGRWETLQPELLTFLEQAKNTTLLIQIALYEGDIDHALHLLKDKEKKDIYGHTYNDSYGYYGSSDIALQVAGAAEETRPHEAIELYRQFAERLIARRGRQSYQQACMFLSKMRTLYEKLGESEAWTKYVSTLREQNRNLRALKEELARAGLRIT